MSEEIKWKRLKGIVNWFKTNKTLKIIATYLKLRAKSKQEIMLRGLGGVLTVWTVAIFAGLVALATGQNPQWGLVAAAGLGATGQYLTQVYRVMLGKPKVTDEEIDSK